MDLARVAVLSLVLLLLSLAPVDASQEGREIALLTVLIVLEAEGEPTLGQAAVAHVAVNRARKLGRPLEEVLFARWEFTGFWVSRRVDRQAFQQASHVAAQVHRGVIPDPTHGATHYLNLARVRTVPIWYEERYVTTTIGRHTFLRLY